MDIATKKYIHPLIFNVELFTINGGPLYFYLDGFEAEEFVGIVRIIEAFGGKLAEPDLPETLVFVPSNTSTPSRNCYDIKFLEDSIVAQELQDLEDYRLSSSVSRKQKRYYLEHANIENDKTNSKKRAVNNREVLIYHRTASETRTNREQSRSLRNINQKILHKLDRIEWCKNDIQSNYKNSEYADFTDSDTSSSLSYNDQKDRDFTPEMIKKHRVKKLRKHHYYTPDENRRLLEYMIKKRTMGLTIQTDIWKDFLAEEVLDDPKPKVRALRQHFTSFLAKNSIKDCEDLAALKKLARNLSCSSENKYSKRIYHSYSHDENRRMIQFLIAKKAIHRGKWLAIWREFLENEIMDDPQPTPRALSKHFQKYLMSQYKKYTDDPAVIKEFERWYGSQKTPQLPSSVNNKPKKSCTKQTSKSSAISHKGEDYESRSQGSSDDDNNNEKSEMSDEVETPSPKSHSFNNKATAEKIEDTFSACSTDNDKIPSQKMKNSTSKIEAALQSKMKSLFEEKAEGLETNAVSSDESDTSSTFPLENSSGAVHSNGKSNFIAFCEKKNKNGSEQTPVGQEKISKTEYSPDQKTQDSSRSPSPCKSDSSPNHRSPEITSTAENACEDTYNNNKKSQPKMKLRGPKSIRKSKKKEKKKEDRRIIYAFLKKQSLKVNSSPDADLLKDSSSKDPKIPEVQNEKLEESTFTTEATDQLAEIGNAATQADAMSDENEANSFMEADINDSHFSANEDENSLIGEMSDGSCSTLPLSGLENYKVPSSNQLEETTSNNDESDNQSMENADSDITEDGADDLKIKGKQEKYSNSPSTSPGSSSSQKSIPKEKQAGEEAKAILHRYTEEDNRRIIEYLIEKNAIDRTKAWWIWRKLIADNVLGDVNLTPAKLAMHFGRTLQYCYWKYTDDPKVLREFEKQNPNSRLWTENEDKAIIDFLIEYNPMHGVLFMDICNQCLQCSPLLQRNNRTAVAIGARYKFYLRYNYYKYIDDSSALKKFKDKTSLFRKLSTKS